jgi:hypothetical protein
MGISEHSEQVAVVRQLTRAKICFTAVPNGGLRDKKAARSISAEGVQPGFPDLLILDPPPAHFGYVGLAIEMKVSNRSKAVVATKQKMWLSKLAERGWLTQVCYGATEAIKYMREQGYEV